MRCWPSLDCVGLDSGQSSRRCEGGPSDGCELLRHPNHPSALEVVEALESRLEAFESGLDSPTGPVP